MDVRVCQISDKAQSGFPHNNTPQVKVMKALEKQLDKAAGKFVTGSRMTMADFVLFSQMQDLKLLRLESGEYPRNGVSQQNLRNLQLIYLKVALS